MRGSPTLVWDRVNKKVKAGSNIQIFIFDLTTLKEAGLMRKLWKCVFINLTHIFM